MDNLKKHRRTNVRAGGSGTRDEIHEPTSSREKIQELTSSREKIHEPIGRLGEKKEMNVMMDPNEEQHWQHEANKKFLQQKESNQSNGKSNGKESNKSNKSNIKSGGSERSNRTIVYVQM